MSRQPVFIAYIINYKQQILAVDKFVKIKLGVN